MIAPIEFNARSIPPAEIARSFIPPQVHFESLLARNHTLVLGPRGSGKTTLFKMLTVKALRNWKHARAEDYARKLAFNAAFIPADVAWGTQIDSLKTSSEGPERKEAAFAIHTLRSLLRAMREAVDLGHAHNPEHLEHLAVSLTSAQEEEFVRLVVDRLGVTPAVGSLLGLEAALESTLDAVAEGGPITNFTVETLATKLSLLISTFNNLSGESDRRWGLLFDEMEIAPTRIKTFLLDSIRSFDDRVVIKLALAPFMDDASFDRSPTSPHPLHDYQTVQLTYPNKEDANIFAIELFIATFDRLGFTVSQLADLFASPQGAPSFGRSQNRSNRHKKNLPREFYSLAIKDDSFKKYCDERGVFLENYARSEKNLAQDVRKVLPIVKARDYYLNHFEAGRVVVSRSRKSHVLYTGYPSVVEITEGNPRAILTLVTPLARELANGFERGRQPTKISASAQSNAIKRIELLLTSLLQVIPLDVSGFEPGKGLLDFIDQIGRSLEERLLRQPFRPDYIGTFSVDMDVSATIVGAIGKALNAGAVVHVPHPDGGPDALLRGLKGQRFRLSYALAARYRLLLTLGDKIGLSRLFHESRGLNLSDDQASLFTSEDGDED
jgi:hypothetical protein